MWSKDMGHFKILCSLFYCALLFPWHFNTVAVAQSKRQLVDVGVILDNTSWIGSISSSCMSIALDDFYATHTNYTTKVQLHYRDSGARVFGAASSALDLLNNVKVQAIIGPQSSAQAKFVIELGGKAHVPVISFSAKSPSLSHKKSPYFIRTGFNDLYQAKAIASIIKNFKWKNVVPIYEDTVYGNGILPYLVDSLQEVDAKIPHRTPLPPNSSADQIMLALNTLKNMSTRVFVVHTTYSLGYELFLNANKLGMMAEGNVWIATYGLTDIVDLMGSKASAVMQGVIGIVPSVKQTPKLKEFKSRWRKQYNMNISEPTVFGLWAYDTVWALADAVEFTSVNNPPVQEINIQKNSSNNFLGLELSSSGPGLMSWLLSTNINNGMSGNFELIEGQLKSGEFDLINFVQNGKKRCGVVGEGEYKINTKIMWPGGKYDVPKGWQWPIEGRNLRIGIPVKPGFEMFVNFKDGIAKGYCIDVFKAAIALLPYHVPCEFVPYQNKTSGEMNGTYDDLVYQVYLKKFDAVVGDITIIANRSMYVDFTLPFTESGVSMVVPIKDYSNKGALAFLAPLTSDLWFASGSFFVFTGFVVWFLEHRVNEDFRGTASNQLGTIFYFAFSTLVFAHRERVVSNLARVVLVIWLFVVLVLQSSYTASLTSILTVEKLQPTVTEIDELLKSGATVGYLDESFMPALLGRLKFGRNKTIPYQSPEEYNEALSNNSVAAIFDEVPYLEIFLSRYCKKYVMAGPTYKTDGFGFVFPIGSPLVPDISRAILQVRESESMTRFEQQLNNKTCPDQDDLSKTSSSLTVRSFWGLFLITGATSISALTIYFICFLHKNRDLLKSNGPENSVRERIGSLVKAYGQMDESRVPKKAVVTEGHETRDIGGTPFSISGPLSPAIISNNGEDGILELEGSTDEDEDEMSGREISNQNDEPSFKDMFVERSSSCSSL